MTRMNTPRKAAMIPKTRPRAAKTALVVVCSRTVPMTRTSVSVVSLAQLGSVSGLAGMSEETSRAQLNDARATNEQSSSR